MDMLHALELDTVFDTIPNPIFMKDENLLFIFINKAYEEMFNVKKCDVIGKQVLDLEYLPMEERVFYQSEDTEMMQSGKTSHHIFEYAHKGKEMHTCLYWSSGFIQRNGKHGLIGIIVDINSQSKRIRMLLNKLRITTTEKKEITEKSKIDSLTQLYTRRTFDETLQHLVASEKNIFSCIMFDIDHFKRVNDTFGHLAGDSVLETVASSLKECSRAPDTAYRYGGEEFAILLPETNLDNAVLVAERIRRDVCETVRLPDGKQVTVSAGCSEYMQGESGASVVQRADQALYAAKNSGRNRVCSQTVSFDIK